MSSAALPAGRVKLERIMNLNFFSEVESCKGAFKRQVRDQEENKNGATCSLIKFDEVFLHLNNY